MSLVIRITMRSQGLCRAKRNSHHCGILAIRPILLISEEVVDETNSY